MADTKITQKDINNYFGLQQLSCKKQTPRWGLKSPGRTFTPSTVPSNSTHTTPASCAVDRFVPQRSASNVQQGSFLLTGKADKDSPGTQEYQRYLYTQMTGEKAQKSVLSISTSENFNTSASAIKTPSEMRIQSGGPVSRTKKARPQRVISKEPEKILDAPGFVDDYYLNLIDWSRSNVLAIALGSSVYMMNSNDGSVEELFHLKGDEHYISSVSWGKAGSYIAVGTTSKEVHIWDISKKKRLRVMGGHEARVGAMSWRQHLLSSGSRDGIILHHDVRKKDNVINRSLKHDKEVCGLKWSRDGLFLASGSNDNTVCVWPQDSLEKPSVVLDHCAAVKGLAWCPWQSNLLATGAGEADKHLRLWNICTGCCVNQVDTESQVTAVIWSKANKEIITSHGSPDYQLSIWNGHSLEKVTDLSGHQGRVLKMVRSPCGSMVATAGADETLRIWKCFDPVVSDASQSGFDSMLCPPSGTLR